MIIHQVALQSVAIKGIQVIFMEIKPMNSHLINKITMQHGNLYFRKILLPGYGLGASL